MKTSLQLNFNSVMPIDKSQDTIAAQEEKRQQQKNNAICLTKHLSTYESRPGSNVASMPCKIYKVKVAPL